jgi:hypothetical protein
MVSPYVSLRSTSTDLVPSIVYWRAVGLFVSGYAPPIPHSGTEPMGVKGPMHACIVQKDTSCQSCRLGFLPCQADLYTIGRASADIAPAAFIPVVTYHLYHRTHAFDTPDLLAGPTKGTERLFVQQGVSVFPSGQQGVLLGEVALVMSRCIQHIASILSMLDLGDAKH